MADLPSEAHTLEPLRRSHFGRCCLVRKDQCAGRTARSSAHPQMSDRGLGLGATADFVILLRPISPKS